MLVARSMLYCWLSVIWCVGVIKEANGDRRREMDGEVINLFNHYEIDDEDIKTVLRVEEYGDNGECGWVLLELVAAEGELGPMELEGEGNAA